MVRGNTPMQVPVSSSQLASGAGYTIRLVLQPGMLTCTLQGDPPQVDGAATTLSFATAVTQTGPIGVISERENVHVTYAATYQLGGP